MAILGFSAPLTDWPEKTEQRTELRIKAAGLADPQTERLPVKGPPLGAGWSFVTFFSAMNDIFIILKAFLNKVGSWVILEESNWKSQGVWGWRIAIVPWLK